MLYTLYNNAVTLAAGTRIGECFVNTVILIVIGFQFCVISAITRSKIQTQKAEPNRL